MSSAALTHSAQITHTTADATHIFDGLDDFATHVAHMRFGSFATPPIAWPPTGESNTVKLGTSMYSIALQWLTEDREVRRELEKAGRKQRGPRHDAVSAVLLQLFDVTDNV